MTGDTSQAPSPIARHAELKSLQVLRALAAAGVVYFHIEAAPRFGSFGVDLFFVVSGFVMAMLVESGESLRVFAASRVARIVPLYWLLTSGVLLLAWLRPGLLNSTSLNPVYYLKSLLFIPYFKENGVLNPVLAVGWTLNYEMLFYTLVVLAMLLWRRHYLPLLAALLTGLFLAGYWADNAVIHGFFGDNQLFEFALGLAAYRIHVRMTDRRWPVAVLLALALAAAAFMAVCESLDIPRDSAKFYYYGPPSFVLVLSVVRLEVWLRQRNARVVQWLVDAGNASYATYLSHLFVLEGIRKIVLSRFDLIDPYHLGGVTLLVAAALIAGHCLYRWVDLPLSRRLKKFLLPRRALAPLLTSSER